MIVNYRQKYSYMTKMDEKRCRKIREQVIKYEEKATDDERQNEGKPGETYDIESEERPKDERRRK